MVSSREHPKPRRGATRALVVALAASTLLALTLSACGQRPPGRVGPEEPSGTETPRGRAETAFAEALEHYETGRFDQAAEAFRLFGATWPEHRLALRAELLLARTLAALGELERARSMFRSLAELGGGEQVGAAAALYLGFVASLSDGAEAATDALAAELARSPTLRVPADVVAPGDDAALASLLAATRVEGGRWVEALPDLGTTHAFASSSDLRDWAIARALEAVQLRVEDPAELDRYLDPDDGDADPFSSAMAAIGRIPSLIRAGDHDRARALLGRHGGTITELAPQQIPAILSGLINTSDTVGAPIYGCVLTLSGANFRAGRAALGGILLAQRAFEARNPTSTLLIRDTRESPSVVREAVHELVDEGALLVIGPVEADLSAVAADAAAARGVPYIGLSPARWSEETEGTYRLSFDARAEARAVIDAATDAWGPLNAVVVRELDPSTYLEAFDAAVRQSLDVQRGRVVRTLELDTDPEAIQEAAASLAEQLATIEADTIAFALPASAGSTLLAHLASKNVWAVPPGGAAGSSSRTWRRYVGNSFMADAGLLRDSGDYAQGMILPYWFLPERAEGVAARFVDRFEYTYGRTPGALEAFARDAAAIGRHLILERGHLHPEALLGALADPDFEFDGVTGAIRFDGEGNPGWLPRIATIDGSGYAPVPRAER